jgi:hypothetical protein
MSLEGALNDNPARWRHTPDDQSRDQDASGLTLSASQIGCRTVKQPRPPTPTDRGSQEGNCAHLSDDFGTSRRRSRINLHHFIVYEEGNGRLWHQAAVYGSAAGRLQWRVHRTVGGRRPNRRPGPRPDSPGRQLTHCDRVCFLHRTPSNRLSLNRGGAANFLLQQQHTIE